MAEIDIKKANGFGKEAVRLALEFISFFIAHIRFLLIV